MPDLHGWITQQIDRIEQTARAVEDRSAPWDGQWVADGPDALRTYNGHVLFYGHNWPLKPGLVEHVALHDPATVLRRCAADRKILAEHRPRGDGYPSHYVCEGCGYDGSYCPEPYTEHVNDCPTLLALAEGYGLTEEQRAQLDRPEKERPTPTGPSLFSNEIMNAYSKALTEMVLDTRPVEPRLMVKLVGPAPALIPDWLREDLGLPAPAPEPTPEEKALEILKPEPDMITWIEPEPFIALDEPSPEPSPETKALEILGPELKKISGYVPTADSEA